MPSTESDDSIQRRRTHSFAKQVSMNRCEWGAVAVGLALGLAACATAGQPTGAPATAASPTSTAAPAVERAPRFTNGDEGYTLRFPADYNVVRYGRSMCLTVAEDVMMACHVANAFVDVSDAGSQTLAEAADAVAAQANPDIEVLRTEIEVGGEPAVLLDDIYAVDVLRKVVVIHGARLYVLTFVPWVEELDDFPRIKELYERVVATFEFTQ